VELDSPLSVILVKETLSYVRCLVLTIYLEVRPLRGVCVVFKVETECCYGYYVKFIIVSFLLEVFPALHVGRPF